MIDPSANTFGLPPCLHLPIAAADIEAITKYVGTVVDRIVASDGRFNALCIEPYNPLLPEDPRVALWHEPNAAYYRQQLHPGKQVWVHVDFRRYRAAYLRFGMSAPAPGHVLDHVQNRQAIRLRGYSHPYLRLCPVSRAVNTSGGVNAGGEGMEKGYVRSLLAASSDEPDGPLAQFARRKIIYADPMDITKMLNIAPGTQVLNGVRDTMQLLYPRTEP
jgi:hypothetical protein